jgi:hypothetical protein
MDTKRKHHPLDDIYEATWRAAGPDPLVISGTNPGKEASIFKHAGIFIARQHGYTFKEIAKAFNLKSHASAIYAFNHIKASHDNNMVMMAMSRIVMELNGEKEAGRE